VDLEPAVLERLSSLQSHLRQCGGDVRWVRPEGIHITLKFLGAVAPQRLDQVNTAVRAGIAGVPAATIGVQGIGGFPSLQRPRILWVGLRDDGTLAELARRIDVALAALGFVEEKRPFRPHATIGRVNSWRGWTAIEKRIDEHINDDFGDSALREVIVYRSTLQRGGAVYTPLWTIPLTENRGTNHDA